MPQTPKSNNTASVMNLKKSSEYEEFEIWCEQNHKYPMKLLRKYCRFTVIHEGDLTQLENKKLG